MDKDQLEALAKTDYDIEDVSSDDDIYNKHAFLVQEDREMRMMRKSHKNVWLT